MPFLLLGFSPDRAISSSSLSNEFMKVQLAKLKADQEKSGKKAEHKENFKKVAALWKTA
ncbi:hypothetical protein I317_00033 [Kwoniella heveanensis CBS 569]|uniref:Uncharacterized protein n=1 Tax=Kwoniella heveanensis BCC8398 TaxID=1296120 RepID=A0A1B9H1T8_9TREE|nr:hypothetical protein I316_01148 [Kwoniella heveanensis BCC8398]OCF45945.1 hypothetical protein I317_00033 [Kwoniella heveanensis CBS 569]